MINPARAVGLPVCVRVRIAEGNVRVVLQAPGCPALAGGGRAPTTDEQRVFELWERRRLNRPDFTGGNLISFLKQLRTLL